jgi:hypothetical protein
VQRDFGVAWNVVETGYCNKVNLVILENPKKIDWNRYPPQKKGSLQQQAANSASKSKKNGDASKKNGEKNGENNGESAKEAASSSSSSRKDGPRDRFKPSPSDEDTTEKPFMPEARTEAGKAAEGGEKAEGDSGAKDSSDAAAASSSGSNGASPTKAKRSSANSNGKRKSSGSMAMVLREQEGVRRTLIVSLLFPRDLEQRMC